MVFLDLPWAEAAAATATAKSAVDVADEVLADIDDHLGDEPFAVIGNSFGGMIARHVAHERRDRVLGVATLAGVVQPAHADRAVPERVCCTPNRPSSKPPTTREQRSRRSASSRTPPRSQRSSGTCCLVSVAPTLL